MQNNSVIWFEIPVIDMNRAKSFYENASENIEAVLSKVETNGGKVMQAKTQISPEIGYMGVFVDSEGNRISLYTNAQV